MSALTVQGRYGVEHIQVDPCAKVLAQPTEDDDLDVLLQLAHDLGELAPHVKVLRAQARRTDREGGHVVSDWKSGEGGGGKSGPAGRGGGGHRTHHRVAALGPVEGDETHEIVIAPRHFKVRLVDHRDNPRLPPLYFCHLRSSCKFSRGNAKKEQVFPGKTRSGYWARASEATWSGAGDAGRGTADGMGGSDAEGSSAKRAKTSEPEEEEEDPLVRRREELVVAAKEARSREDARAERVAKERVVDLVR